MDRAEQTGLGIAVAGHAALFALLSLGLVSTAKLPPLHTDSLDVSLVDEVAMRSAAPQPATEAPAPAEAPELGPVEDAPPEAAPAPAEPAPKPSDVPTVPKPAVKPKPEEKSEPKDLPDLGDRRRPDRQMKGKAEAKADAKPTGSRLGKDFLKGLSDAPQGKGRSPRAATVGPAQMAGLAAALFRQFKPCYDLGAMGGTSAMSIQTVLRLRYKPDGTVAVDPVLVEQTGVNAGNGAYAKQMQEAAIRAVKRCTPVRLPPTLYEGGWDDFELNFVPGQLG